MPWHFGLLSLCPRIRRQRERLIAETAWRLRLVTLGCNYRRVVVDPKQKVVILHRRCLWFFPRTQHIPFRAIQAVTYGYQDWSISQYFWWAHDAFDVFRVGLLLQNGREIPLFHFFGEGVWTITAAPWPESWNWWIYWKEYLTDCAGTQERESYYFATVLSKMLAVPIRPA
ncbi:hypothetical protein HRbin36_01166 [bacterium HR36]|nr:hypothetical protein HRbin36_01166 [bacterium HR36]